MVQLLKLAIRNVLTPFGVWIEGDHKTDKSWKFLCLFSFPAIIRPHQFCSLQVRFKRLKGFPLHYFDTRIGTYGETNHFDTKKNITVCANTRIKIVRWKCR
jgi:hypothetical protein